VSAVKVACERLMAQANGETGLLLLAVEDGFAEFVLVRRADLELLLATWHEKRT
jgi:hypothetical protein